MHKISDSQFLHTVHSVHLGNVPVRNIALEFDSVPEHQTRIGDGAHVPFGEIPRETSGPIEHALCSCDFGNCKFMIKVRNARKYTSSEQICYPHLPSQFETSPRNHSAFSNIDSISSTFETSQPVRSPPWNRVLSLNMYFIVVTFETSHP